MIDPADEGRTQWFEECAEISPEVWARMCIESEILYKEYEARYQIAQGIRHLQRCHSQGLRRMREAAAREMAPHMRRCDRGQRYQRYQRYVNWMMTQMVDHMKFGVSER